MYILLPCARLARGRIESKAGVRDIQARCLTARRVLSGACELTGSTYQAPQSQQFLLLPVKRALLARLLSVPPPRSPCPAVAQRPASR